MANNIKSKTTENQRQGINHTLLNFLALGISLISTIFIFPKNIEAYGVIQFLISTSFLLLPFTTLGSGGTLNKFFPEFEPDGKLPNLLGLMSLIIVLSSFLFFVTCFLFEEPIYIMLDRLDFDVELLKKVDFYLMGITFFTSFSMFFMGYATLYKKIAVPSIINDLLSKIGIPLIVLLAIYFAFDEKQISLAFLFLSFLIFTSNILYLKRLRVFKLRWPRSYTQKKFKQIAEYISFTFFGGLGYLLVYRLDLFMIAMLLDTKQTGYYAILLFLASTIEIPGKGLFKLFAPQISSALAVKDLAKVKNLYIKTSENLMLVAGSMAIVTYAGINSFFSLMENGEFLLQSINIWFLLMLAKWFDQITGINSSIINYSRFYKANILFIFLQGLMNVVLNLLLIKHYGLIGAAISTLCSVFIFNFTKSLFIYIVLHISPWSKRYAPILLFLIVCSILVYFTPLSGYVVFDFIGRPLVFGTVIAIAMYKLKLSLEINDNFDLILDKIKKR